MALAVGAETEAPAQNAGGEMSAQEIINRTRDAYASLASYHDDGQAVCEIGGRKLALTFSIRMERPKSYRVDWTQDTGLKGAAWSDGSANLLRIEPGSMTNPAAMASLAASGLTGAPNTQTVADLKTALAKAAPLSYSVAATIPGAFFNQDCGDVFVYPAIAGRYPLKKEADARVDEVDCYVVSSETDLSKVPGAGKPGTVAATLWIGKQDFLVHQTRSRYVEKVDENALANDQAVDEAIKKSLQLQNKPVTPEAIAALRPQMRQIMKQVESSLKASFQEGVVMTQTHERIVLNQSFSPADFSR